MPGVIVMELQRRGSTRRSDNTENDPYSRIVVAFNARHQDHLLQWPSGAPTHARTHTRAHAPRPHIFITASWASQLEKACPVKIALSAIAYKAVANHQFPSYLASR